MKTDPIKLPVPFQAESDRDFCATLLEELQQKVVRSREPPVPGRIIESTEVARLEFCSFFASAAPDNLPSALFNRHRLLDLMTFVQELWADATDRPDLRHLTEAARSATVETLRLLYPMFYFLSERPPASTREAARRHTRRPPRDVDNAGEVARRGELWVRLLVGSLLAEFQKAGELASSSGGSSQPSEPDALYPFVDRPDSEPPRLKGDGPQNYFSALLQRLATRGASQEAALDASQMGAAADVLDIALLTIPGISLADASEILRPRGVRFREPNSKNGWQDRIGKLTEAGFRFRSFIDPATATPLDSSPDSATARSAAWTNEGRHYRPHERLTLAPGQHQTVCQQISSHLATGDNDAANALRAALRQISDGLDRRARQTRRRRYRRLAAATAVVAASPGLDAAEERGALRRLAEEVLALRHRGEPWAEASIYRFLRPWAGAFSKLALAQIQTLQHEFVLVSISVVHSCFENSPPGVAELLPNNEPWPAPSLKELCDQLIDRLKTLHQWLRRELDEPGPTEPHRLRRLEGGVRTSFELALLLRLDVERCAGQAVRDRDRVGDTVLEHLPKLGGVDEHAFLELVAATEPDPSKIRSALEELSARARTRRQYHSSRRRRRGKHGPEHRGAGSLPVRGPQRLREATVQSWLWRLVAAVYLLERTVADYAWQPQLEEAPDPPAINEQICDLAEELLSDVARRLQRPLRARSYAVVRFISGLDLRLARGLEPDIAELLPLFDRVQLQGGVEAVERLERLMERIRHRALLAAQVAPAMNSHRWAEIDAEIDLMQLTEPPRAGAASA